MTIGLCKKLFDEISDLNYVFIHTSSDVEILRSKLRPTLGEKESRVVVYYGDRSIEFELDALYYNYAERIYILGEDGQEALHDAKYIKCVSYLNKHITKELPCYVLFFHQMIIVLCIVPRFVRCMYCFRFFLLLPLSNDRKILHPVRLKSDL